MLLNDQAIAVAREVIEECEKVSNNLERIMVDSKELTTEDREFAHGLIAGLSIAQTMARNLIRSGLGGVK